MPGKVRHREVNQADSWALFLQQRRNSAAILPGLDALVPRYLKHHLQRDETLFLIINNQYLGLLSDQWSLQAEFMQ